MARRRKTKAGASEQSEGASAAVVEDDASSRPLKLPREVKDRIVRFVAELEGYHSQGYLTALGFANKEWRKAVMSKLFKSVTIRNELGWSLSRTRAERMLQTAKRFALAEATWLSIAPFVQRINAHKLLDLTSTGELPALRHLSLSNKGLDRSRDSLILPTTYSDIRDTLLGFRAGPAFSSLTVDVEGPGDHAVVEEQYWDLLDIIRAPICRQLTEICIRYDPSAGYVGDGPIVWLLSALADIPRKLSIQDVIRPSISNLNRCMDTRRRFNRLETLEVTASEDDRTTPSQRSNASNSQGLAQVDGILLGVLERSGSRLSSVVVDRAVCLADPSSVNFNHLTGLEEVRIVRCGQNARFAALFRHTAVRKLAFDFFVPYHEDDDFQDRCSFDGMDDLSDFNVSAMFAVGHFGRLEQVSLGVREWWQQNDTDVGSTDSFGLANDPVAESVFSCCSEMERVLSDRGVEVERDRTTLMPPSDPRYLPPFHHSLDSPRFNDIMASRLKALEAAVAAVQ